MNKRRRQSKRVVESLISLIVVLLLGMIGAFYANGSHPLNEKQDIQNNQRNNAISQTVEKGETLEVYFLDVGQADSILVRNQGQTLLIDAGNNADGNWLVAKLQELGVSKLDYVVGTHPHEDHIGGLDNVITHLDIGTIFMPKIQTNTKTFEEVLDAVSQKGLTIKAPVVGDSFLVGNAVCEIMACGTGSKEEKSNLNLASIVIRTTYGENSFLFMGDAEEKNESARTWPQTTVLKVGHHGSDTSSSNSFLKQVKPEISIISVGKDNSYGHPKNTILKRLQNLKAKIYRTDESGTVFITSDGKTVSVQTEK